jgi:LuxR family maltose regulon positive regulatory protein
LPESLLASKLQPPRLRPSLVPRPRLTARLQQAREGKLTVVAAPAGSGKTTAVRQWLAEIPGLAWVALEPDDSDPVRFWRYVISAAQQAFDSDVGSESLAQLEQPLSIYSGLRPVLSAFVNELANVEESAVLVLEDYHAIVAEQVHSGLMFVLDHLPPQVHVVLISRGTPPLPLARLRASGDLLEIGGNDLRFSRTELSTLLDQASRTQLGEADIERVDTSFEGWAAGLRLLAVALQADHDRSVIDRMLSGSGPHRRELTDYFLTEVMHSQPAAVQDFIVRTSFLDRFTAALCEAVTGVPGADDMLQYLEQRNLFVESLEGPGDWYRYHALFASAMQLEAHRRLGESGVVEVLQRASNWYLQNDMLPEAIDAAFDAGDTATAVDLLERLIDQHYSSTRPEAPFPPNLHALTRWLPRVPPATLDERPLASFGLAMPLFFTPLLQMRPTTMVPVDLIEHLLGIAEQGFAASGENAYMGRVLGFRAMLAQQRGLVEDGGRWSAAALDLLPEVDLVWRNICLCGVGFAEMHAGHTFEAARRFAEARALCEPGGLESFARVSSGLLGWALLEGADLRGAASLFQGMLVAARRHDDIDDVGRALHGLAEISLWRNDLEDARARAEEVLQLVQQFPYVAFYTHAALIVARIDLAMGEANAALARCEALLAQREPLGDPTDRQLQAEIELQAASIALQAGAIARVRTWLDSKQPDLGRDRAQVDREHLLIARLHLHDGKASAAIDVARPVLRSAVRDGRGRVALEARMVLALALAADDQEQAATTALIEALSIAEPMAARRVFLGAGPRMTSLLRTTLQAIQDPRLAGFVRSLLRSGAEPAESLSAREIEVLRLLAAGRDNAAIAKELIVSLNTVKAHVKSIYRKLAVSNRAEASIAARDLHLV